MKTNEKYKKRLIDEQLKDWIKLSGCLVIEGPKWCGKTWTSRNLCENEILLSDYKEIDKIKNFPEMIFNAKTYHYPLLIDEWQNVPLIWDLIRNKVDEMNPIYKFILTGSTSMKNLYKKKQVFHSGTGRMIKFNMWTMSLYESGDSDGSISILDMFNHKNVNKKHNKISIEKIIDLILSGGWPAKLHMENKQQTYAIPKKYLSAIINNETITSKSKSPHTMKLILKSLARNESTVVSENTILNDCFDAKSDSQRTIARNTLTNYLDFLRSLYVLVEDEAFSINYRSSKKVGKSTKKHLVDPSLSCACLNLTKDKLLNDIKTLGLMFEGLVIRDLRIYAQALNAELYHFRDNSSGDEIDAIIEFENGEYACFEIKLSFNSYDEAKKSLIKFKEAVVKKPIFSCVITGVDDFSAYDKENNIYVVPITALKP